MNILILSDLIAYSGVGQYMVQLGETIALNKENTVVMASSCIIRTDISENIITIKLSNPRKVFRYLKQLHSIIKARNIQVVHVNHRMTAFMMRLYQLIYGKIATVWTCHTVPYPNNIIKRLLGYYGHKTIAISEEAKVWMREELHIDESRVDKVINGVDNTSLVIPQIDKSKLKEEFFEKRFNEKIDGLNTKIIVAHGRLDPVKGLDLLIKAFSKLDEDYKKNLSIVFSGDVNTPYCQKLITLISQLGVSKYVKFVGWIASAEILSIADLMVQPSHREGFPLAVLEAFFMKVPVIRTKTGGYRDMQHCCIGVPIGDMDAVHKELISWLGKPDCYSQMVEDAFRFANNECTVQTMTNKTIEVYKSAIKICQ